MSGDGYDDPPRPRDSVHAVEIEGELVLYDTELNRAVHLDPRATLVWQVLDGSVTVDELVEDLSSVFGTDAPTIRSDLDAMLARLHGLGFLEPGLTSPSASPGVLPDPPSP
jgi:hypothetical protein